MDTQESYATLARAYVAEVNALFASPPTQAAERSLRGPSSPVEVAERGEQLLSLSTALQDVVVEKLSSDDPHINTEGATELLAKAVSDLEVSLYILQVAEDEEAGLGLSAGEGAQRRAGAKPSADLNEPLKILLGEDEDNAVVPERSSRGPRQLEDLRAETHETIELTLFQISERASDAGQRTFEGLLAMGFVELGQVAGAVGAHVAQYFGVAEKVTRLYNLFRAFLSKIYDGIISLLGPSAAQMAAGLVVNWWEDWKDSRLFNTLIVRLYETGQTKEYLKARVDHSQADTERFFSTIERVKGMDKEYGRQVRLAEKFLHGMRYASGVATAVLPYGALIAGAAYIVLCGYIVLIGADYADAAHLSLLKRVPGVRDVVNAQL
ncbi:MAG: hypothetical protein WCB68_11500 [Pyrinomonadaceae bacterium]